jgi:hypothetical protein
VSLTFVGKLLADKGRFVETPLVTAATFDQKAQSAVTFFRSEFTQRFFKRQPAF